jgi:hypothetical protein
MPRCGWVMRLARVSADLLYKRVVERSYSCECGEADIRFGSRRCGRLIRGSGRLNYSWANRQSFCPNLREPPAYRAEIGPVGSKRARHPFLFPRDRWGLEVARHPASPERERCGPCCRVKSRVDLGRTAFGPTRSKHTARSTLLQLFYAYRPGLQFGRALRGRAPLK